MMSTTLPWDLAPDLPWHVFTNPAEKWAAQPSFLLGEYLFITCAAIALVHAFSQGVERRKHVLAWFAALLAGTACDMTFMALPLVDNFWQAQATIMLTPRLPLYIPCVYICFMYIPLVAVWRLHLPPLARAALTGLCASIFYGPYDIVGAKFLWWTWHDTDPAIARRILGAPIGSTMWVISFAASYAWLFNRVVDRDPAVKPKSIAKALALVAALSSLLIIIQVTALRPLDGGTPGPRGLGALILLYGAFVVTGWQRAAPEPLRRSDRLLMLAVVAYFTSLFAIGASFNPETHRSASLHQTYGPCHVKATDIGGNVRDKFICAADFDEDFTFSCVDALPKEGSDFYTVCGKPHRSYGRFISGVLLLCGLGALVFSFLFGAFRRRNRVAAPSAAAAKEA